MREHSVAVIAAQSSELSGLMRDPGDGARPDQADMGATSFERDQELAVINSERDKLAPDRAGAGAHRGRHVRRLRVVRGADRQESAHVFMPHATLCMTCKQREERR